MTTHWPRNTEGTRGASEEKRKRGEGEDGIGRRGGKAEVEIGKEKERLDADDDGTKIEKMRDRKSMGRS